MNWDRFQIQLPDCWESERHETSIVLFPEELRDSVVAGAPACTVTIATIARGEAVAVVAQRTMARRVAQGVAELGAAVFAGEPALECRWTDGVTAVVSWFFAQAGVVYEVARSEPLLGIGAGSVRAIEAKALCSGGIRFGRARVYVDFNEMLEADLVLLSQGDTTLDSWGATVELHEGLKVHIYQDDLDAAGCKDDLIADGVVEKCSGAGWAAAAKWCCRIDGRGIRNVSDEEP